MKSREHSVGILLAGGKSSRMGGGDKCLLPLGGRPILKPRIQVPASATATRHLLSAVWSRIGSGAMPGLLPAFLPDLSGRAPIGPRAASRSPPRATRPSFPPISSADFARRAVRACRTSPWPGSADGMHAVFGLWPITIAPDLEASLLSGDRKVSDWVRQHHAKEVMFPPVKIEGRIIDPFFNVNRPDDLVAAEAFLQTSAV